MENAVEALKMAAGLIIAVLLITLLIYTFNIISNTENTKKDQKVAQEITEYNRQFLAFDKTSMYGTDLISILSLAISTNEIYNQQYKVDGGTDGRYYEERDGTINIVFEIKTPISQTTTYFIKKANEGWRKIDPDKYEGDRGLLPNGTVTNPETTELLKADKYTLDNKKNADEDYKNPNSNIQKIRRIATEGNSKHIIQMTANKRKEEDLTGFNDLKSKIFECTKVETRQNGKICSMTFVEKDVK